MNTDMPRTQRFIASVSLVVVLAACAEGGSSSSIYESAAFVNTAPPLSAEAEPQGSSRSLPEASMRRHSGMSTFSGGVAIRLRVSKDPC